jgi:hypothetical protein
VWSASSPGHFIPGKKNPRYPLDRRLGRPQKRYGHGEKKALGPTGTRTLSIGKMPRVLFKSFHSLERVKISEDRMVNCPSIVSIITQYSHQYSVLWSLLFTGIPCPLARYSETSTSPHDRLSLHYQTILKLLSFSVKNSDFFFFFLLLGAVTDVFFYC